MGDDDGDEEEDEEDEEEEKGAAARSVRRQYVDSTGVERTYVERHLDYAWDSDNGDNGDDDDALAEYDDDEMKYGYAAYDYLLSEEEAQQREGYGDRSCDSENDGAGGYGDDE